MSSPFQPADKDTPLASDRYFIEGYRVTKEKLMTLGLTSRLKSL